MYTHFDQINLPLGIYHTKILSRTRIHIQECSLQHSYNREKSKHKQFLPHYLQLLIENVQYIRVVGKE